MFRRLTQLLQALGVLAFAATLTAPVTWADSSLARLKNCAPFDWCTYHRTYDGQRHSPLKQITAENVSALRPAWIFQPGNVRQGLQSTPLAIDGKVYVATNVSRVWKLDGETGKREWVYSPELNEAVVTRSFFAHTRGMTLGDGRVYMGTADGRVVALSMDNGSVLWENQVVNSEKESAGFSGAGTFAGDVLVIGQNGGEYPVEGKVFGLDPATGQLKWTFYTTGRDDAEALKTWGGDSWMYGGGGSWQPGSVDWENNQIILGTGNPNPDYDWGGKDWRTTGQRPGINLYTSSTVALNLKTGKVNWYFSEAPHDPYDYDAAPGEYVLIEKDGRKIVLHPGKNGFNHVHDRKTGEVLAVYPDTKNYNWTTGYNKATGEWENMLFPEEGVKTLVCPAIDGGHSWNAGSYNPNTGMFYRLTQEWCMWLTVNREGRITEPVAQPLFAAEFTNEKPADPNNKSQPGSEKQHGWLTAREPVSGSLAWEKRYSVIPHSALLTTGSNLLFVGTATGELQALDAANGNELWSFNNGSSHNGGIISYAAGGKQFIAAATGHGSYVGYGTASLFPDEMKGYADSAALVVYSLPFKK